VASHRISTSNTPYNTPPRNVTSTPNVNTDRIDNNINNNNNTSHNNNNNNNNNSNNNNSNNQGANTNNGGGYFNMKSLTNQMKKKIQIIFIWILKFHKMVIDVKDFSCLEFCDFYPYLKAFYKLSVFCSKCSYLLGFSTRIHPVLAVLGITLVKKNEEIGSSQIAETGNSIQKTLLGAKNPLHSFNALSTEAKSLLVITALISVRVADLLLRTERPGSNAWSGNFIFNFFRGSNRPDPSGDQNGDQGGNNIPAPPKALKPGRGCLIPPNSKTCSICRKKQVNPCAASSGYVFCYLCLLNFVRDSPVCPVAGIPCTENDILRIYEDNNDNS
jgi:hypothetical protein